MSMKEKVDALRETIKSYVVSNDEDLESFRMRYISKRSEIAALFGALKDIPADKKKEAGQVLNDLKNYSLERFKELIASLEQKSQKC